MDDQQEQNKDDLVEVEAQKQPNLVRLERAGALWAYVAHYPAEKTAAGATVPASETLIRVTTEEHGTVTLVSALREELPFIRGLAKMFSDATGLMVSLRRFKEEIEEEVIADGRVCSLNRIIVPKGEIVC
jgi:hypothetical protein